MSKIVIPFVAVVVVVVVVVAAVVTMKLSVVTATWLNTVDLNAVGHAAAGCHPPACPPARQAALHPFQKLSLCFFKRKITFLF